MKPPCIVGILLYTLSLTSAPAGGRTLKEGDVVFQVSTRPDPVLLATRSKYGHVGMILKHKGELMFYEAVSPVRFTPLKTWLRKQKKTQFVVRRLKNAGEILTSRNLSRLDSAASILEGRPYDSWYNWSDEKLYCSELVWKLYHRVLGVDLCELRKLKSYDLTSPEVQKKLKERFPDGAPLEETMVSPQDLFESKVLVTVYQQ